MLVFTFIIYLLTSVDSGLCFCKYFDGVCYKLFHNEAKKLLNYNNQTEDTPCLEPGYTKECSNNGKCVNSTCLCTKIESVDEKNQTDASYRFSGKYCEEFPYGKGDRCGKIIQYIHCISKNDTNCDIVVRVFYLKTDQLARRRILEKTCEMEFENGCYQKFKYFYDEDGDLILSFESSRFCVDGSKYLYYLFWAVISYIVILMIIIHRLGTNLLWE